MSGGFQPLAFQPAYQQIAATGGVEGEADPGWVFFIRHQEELSRKRKKRREREEAFEAAQDLKPVDREIANLLHQQERTDEREADLGRLRALVDNYSDIEAEKRMDARLQDAFIRARERQTLSALMNLEKQLKRFYEEEEFAVLMMLIND